MKLFTQKESDLRAIHFFYILREITEASTIIPALNRGPDPEVFISLKPYQYRYYFPPAPQSLYNID